MATVRTVKVLPKQELSSLIRERLVCPRDQASLTFAENRISCEQGHVYPMVEGVPVLLVSDAAQTHGEARKALQVSWSDNAAEQVGITTMTDEINPHVQQLVASTCGLLYRPLIGKLKRYPIPELRLSLGEGRTLIDIGCSWGRWTIAAARKNYCAVGMDPSLGAVLVARQVSMQLGVKCDFIVADARYLPFRSQSIDVAFSYSVIQHFSRDDADRALEEIGRVLTHSGSSLIQMPNAYGLRSLYHLARRGRREPKGFDVRYWTPRELKKAFHEKIGTPEIAVDGFFGLGIQSSDVDLLPFYYQPIARFSELLRSAASYAPGLTNFADSLWVEARRN